MFVPNSTDYHVVVMGIWLCRGIASLSDHYLKAPLLLEQIQDAK